MKQLLLIFSFLVLAVKSALAQTATFIFSQNGVAPIPAFNLGKPAGLVFFKTNLGKYLEFSPDVTFSLKDGRLWFSDMWLRGNIPLDSTGRWIATIGVDFPSYFGQPFTGQSGEKIDQILRYPTCQAKLRRTFKGGNTITFDYWYTQAIEAEYGVKGSYISLSCNWNKSLGADFSFNAIPNLFFLSYSDGTKGFASSVNATVSHNKTGLFIDVLGLTSLTAKKVNPAYSVSLGITRKLF